jgi:hypothetical protein
MMGESTPKYDPAFQFSLNPNFPGLHERDMETLGHTLENFLAEKDVQACTAAQSFLLYYLQYSHIGFIRENVDARRWIQSMTDDELEKFSQGILGESVESSLSGSGKDHLHLDNSPVSEDPFVLYWYGKTTTEVILAIAVEQEKRFNRKEK